MTEVGRMYILGIVSTSLLLLLLGLDLRRLDQMLSVVWSVHDLVFDTVGVGQPQIVIAQTLVDLRA